MLKRALLLALSVFFLTFSGCTEIAKKAPPIVVVPATNLMSSLYKWNDFGAYSCCGDMWYTEAKRRFPNQDPIVLIAHGGEGFLFDYTNEGVMIKYGWYLSPDAPRRKMLVVDAAKMLTDMAPGRPIVIVACNPQGEDLDIPNVYYAKSSIWLVPDRYATDWFAHETMKNYDAVGDIDEFVTFDLSQAATRPAKKYPTSQIYYVPVPTPPSDYLPYFKWFPQIPTSQPATTKPTTKPSSKPVTRPTTQSVKR